MNIVTTYWDFVNRPVPQVETPRGWDILPTFIRDLCICVAMFSMLYITIPIIARRYFGEWYNSLDKRKRRELPTYIVCIIHHTLTTPRAAWHILQDFMLTPSQAAVFNYALKEANVAPFSIGFFTADTIWMALPDLIFHGRVELLIHHVLIIGLVSAGLLVPGELCRFIPHLGVTETSNLFFNIAWLLRACGYRDTAMVTACELAFAISFFFTRVINLTAVFYVINLNPNAKLLGWARYLMLPLALMQFYWFFLIARGMASRLIPKKPEKSE